MTLIDDHYYIYTDGETDSLKLVQYLGPLHIPEELAGYGFEDCEDGPVHVFGHGSGNIFDVALFDDELAEHIQHLTALDVFLLGVNQNDS